ncbi:MAG TPA: DUF1932 domain-containing protein [Acidimicrobiales bacterium]|nr:DUF1932 domain-containing protein [Acidimicrobiales bacterium]
MATGLLHPGSMGTALGTALDGTVLWAGKGRSQATRDRAVAAGFSEVSDLETLCRRSTAIVSVCPPGAAEEVARQVASTGFTGVYLDANAVAPATARRIGGLFDRFVDGGIIGLPPTPERRAALYLSGDDAAAVDEMAGLFSHGLFDVRRVEGGIGAASAVKVCFAAWTKGTAALLTVINALAEAEGVSEVLGEEWAISMPDLPPRSRATAAAVGPKAWRFGGELREIAAALADAGLPTGFASAAADTYDRLATLVDVPGPTLEDAVELLLGRSRTTRAT